MSPRLPPFADRLSVTLLLHDPGTEAIVDANAAAESLYGYPVEELRTLAISEVSTESPRFSGEEAERRIRAAAEGTERVFEWQIRRRDGEVRWVRVRLSPTDVNGSRYVLAEIEDVTEFKTRTRRLQLLHRIIRHNLRNDMNVVMGHAESLQRALDEEDRRRQTEIIQEVAEDVGGLTESVARIEEIATNDATDFVPTDVVAVLEDVAAEFGAAAPDARIDVVGDDEVWVSADRGLRYGVESAVTNAIEHNDRPEPTVTLRARSTTATDGVPSRAIVEVVDDGPPIPDVEVDAIAADEQVSETYHGTGVGMFVMKWCAESLGGSLTIRESSPRGNVVEFAFPLLRAPDET